MSEARFAPRARPGAARLAHVLEQAVATLATSGSESARLDAELLLGHVLGIDRTSVLAHPEAAVGDSQLERFRTAVDRRARGEPVAYIRGIKEFFGNAFSVDGRALIPRPETEALVEVAFREIRDRLTSTARPPRGTAVRLLDVGTGSGAIAVSITLALRRMGAAGDVFVAASDVSPDALQLAIENAVAHGVADLIVFREADLIPLDLVDREPFDLVVANLPYVPSADVANLPIAASYEPRLALDGGPDGLATIRRLLTELPAALAPGGRALLEIGSDQAGRMEAAVAAALPGWSVTVHPDLAGQPRVSVLTGPNSADG